MKPNLKPFLLVLKTQPKKCRTQTFAELCTNGNQRQKISLKSCATCINADIWYLFTLAFERKTANVGTQKTF